MDFGDGKSPYTRPFSEGKNKYPFIEYHRNDKRTPMSNDELMKVRFDNGKISNSEYLDYKLRTDYDKTIEQLTKYHRAKGQSEDEVSSMIKKIIRFNSLDNYRKCCED
jgi:hypothetical protein